VLDLIRRVRDRGIAVVLVSHNMPEVLQVSDRIEVLRLGRRVATFKASEASMEDLVGAMTGAISQAARPADSSGQAVDSRSDQSDQGVR
jgi:simple sugar transport system ATP-binding protein